jgi:arabinofuranan 3-O-arabinosyltransferase
VYVDGHRHLTKVDGVMGDVASSGPLAMSLCEGPLEIGAGRHRIRIVSTSQFQPVRVVLAEPDALADTEQANAEPARSLDVLAETATDQRVRIGAGASALLVTGRNWNKGWVATLDGKTLRPQRIDGWAQGWRVPAGRGGVVHVEYGPQRAYLIGLSGGLAIAGVMLLLAVVLLLRRGLRSAADPPLRARGRRRASADALGSATLVCVGYVAGGVAGLAGTLLARLPGGRRSLRLALAGVLMAAGTAVTATTFVVQGPDVVPDAANVLAGIGAVLALVLGLDGSDERS